VAPTFGVDLGEQMLRDGVEVPRVLEKCAEAIELYGLESKGIYRLSGTTSRVQRLKAALDYGERVLQSLLLIASADSCGAQTPRRSTCCPRRI
jgi:hypothetical protein